MRGTRRTAKSGRSKPALVWGGARRGEARGAAARLRFGRASVLLALPPGAGGSPAVFLLLACLRTGPSPPGRTRTSCVTRARARGMRAARAPSCPLPRSPPEFTEASQTHPPMSWYRKRREHLCREPNTDDRANSHTPVSWCSLSALSVRHVGRAWLLVCTRP